MNRLLIFALLATAATAQTIKPTIITRPAVQKLPAAASPVIGTTKVLTLDAAQGDSATAVGLKESSLAALLDLSSPLAVTGVPSGTPATGAPHFRYDTAVSPARLYFWDGSAWVVAQPQNPWDRWLLTPSDADTIQPSESGIGWAEGKFTIQTPAGSLQFYQTGSPLEDVIYWPGRFTVGSLEAANITGEISGALITSGQIPGGVMVTSMPAPLSGFMNDSSHAGTIGGLTYGTTGPGGTTEPTTPGLYFAAIEVTDGTDVVNDLQGRIKTFAQMGVAKLVSAPATATSTGTAGSIAYDSSYFYVCTATNTWKRTALSTW